MTNEEIKSKIIDILKQSETEDIDPPYRVMAAGYSNKWYEYKAIRLLNLLFNEGML